jgi:hypothetical protein
VLRSQHGSLGSQRRPPAPALGARLTRSFVCVLSAALLVTAIGLASSSRRSTVAFAQATLAASDWPQHARDAQRRGWSPQQIDPPYCYAWKWYEAPIASRAQPVVVDGRLFVGAMDGVIYARNASTGAALWRTSTDGPIRHSVAVFDNLVIASSHDGSTYALDVIGGNVRWKATTGPSATTPLIDAVRRVAYVGATDGRFSAISLTSGAVVWQVDLGAPVLTSAALSEDGTLVFLGVESMEAVAVEATSGAVKWKRKLAGQSLADRYPVVVGGSVIYRSQPLDFFQDLLHEGDDVMDQAGRRTGDWEGDWGSIKPRIVSYLSANPEKQTLFVLETADGRSRGVAPVLYTFGDNDPPSPPVVHDSTVYTVYRARHGIQTDSPSAVHVSSRYDAELGRFDLTTFDIAGLQQSNPPAFNYELRLTSDEPAILSMGGDILWVDSWERAGGLNVKTGALVHAAAVSSDWPECSTQCGPGTSAPFFPMKGSGPAYPFPNPRVTEGHQRGGIVIANNMVYWRVIEGGLAAMSHASGASCPTPAVWSAEASETTSRAPALRPQAGERPLSDYVTTDLTRPSGAPPPDLAARLRAEVRELVSTREHVTPLYFQRGFSSPIVWPYNAASTDPPAISHNGHGNVVWHDPGELLYTVALAYPYLDSGEQRALREYVYDELERYPLLENLPFEGLRWLKHGTQREAYAVPFRDALNAWPSPAVNLSALYALWLWSRTTNDWSYAREHWPDATRLFEARRSSMPYYADIAGAIGYARLAAELGEAAATDAGTQAAIAAMQAGKDFERYRRLAESTYLDPRNQATGWSAPVFYGLTPEVGLYLREQVGAPALEYLTSKEEGNGVRWWYLTRAGAHAEAGESSYLAPATAWSHFLAHAYIGGASRDQLRRWLDRPWARSDLYFIQKLVATIQAP